MRKVIASTFLSVDGVMQAPGGPDEDPTGGFTHGGWTVNYWDEPMGKVMDEIMIFDNEKALESLRAFESYTVH